MLQHIVKIKSIILITHDVLKIVTEKPLNYNFIPGQATLICLNKTSWRAKKRPFTFTSLPGDNYLEFTIKTYPEHKGVTNELLSLGKNDELIIHEVFGTISYKREGIFIAGGAGITPFISIFRDLKIKNKMGNNKLIFANKTKTDIILELEFKKLLGKNFINILSRQELKGYAYGKISKEFIKKNSYGTNIHFYLCGPPAMMIEIEQQLMNLKINKKLITKEIF